METAKDIVTIFGTLAAVVIGFLGLKIWRIQQRSTADTDLARRILVCLYKIKMSIALMRRPIKDAPAIPEEKRGDPKAYAEALEKQYEEEWNKLREERLELQVASIEAQALWDRDFMNNFIPLNVCLGELLDNIYDYLEVRKQGYRDPDYQPAKTRQIMFGTGGDSDEFSKELDKVISDIDGKVRVKLERESFWHSLI
jgi:hypothetical protein